MRLAIAAATIAALITGTAAADSFTPVRLGVAIAPVARLHKPLSIAVTVSADAGALDDRLAPLRIEIRLAGECGGTFETTSGPVLLNRLLNPQPATGHPYYALARAAGRPRSYGLKTVCVYLEEEGDSRLWAHQESVQVDVSRACTLAAARDDRRHTRRDRRAARRACGAGVPL